MEPNERADELIEELDAVPEQRAAPLRAVRRDHTRHIDLARAILDTGRYRWIAYELIAEHQAAFRYLEWREP